MAIRVKGFRAKRIASGTAHYWEPNAPERKAGWKPLTLDRDLSRAVAQAAARNAEIEAWRTGGAAPRAVARFNKRATVDALIAAYQAAGYPGVKVKGRSVGPATQRVYASALKKLSAWAGVERADQITTRNVAVWIEKTLRVGYGEEVAHAAVRVARTLFTWAMSQGHVPANPFLDPGLATPAPRDQVWQHADELAFDTAAAAIGYPGLAFARELAVFCAQREADLLALDASQWRPMRPLELAGSYDQLAALDPRGDVWGIYVRQGKTKRWIGIPIVGGLRHKIEAAIAANARREVATTAILVDDATGRPWAVRQFIRKFVAAKARAIADGHEALDGLQFRDLRRTRVVRLGELGLDDAAIASMTGHRLATIKKILETYMPRTTAMAGRAVVAMMADHRPPREQEKSA